MGFAALYPSYGYGVSTKFSHSLIDYSRLRFWRGGGVFFVTLFSRTPNQ
jgi:hypothetical protein